MELTEQKFKEQFKKELEKELAPIEISDYQKFSKPKKLQRKAFFLWRFYRMVDFIKYGEIEIPLSVAVGTGAVGLALIMSAVGLYWVSPIYLQNVSEVIKQFEQSGIEPF